MSKLAATEGILSEWEASGRFDPGVHQAAETRTGRKGRPIGEVPYNPVRHKPHAIDPFSLMGMVTGVPHVKVVLPRQALDMNVVLHHTNKADPLGLHAQKLEVFEDIDEALAGSAPGYSDHVGRYIVGPGASQYGRRLGKAIETDGSPKSDSDEIANICKRGLTFVISDFSRLPLGEQPAASFPATVAVKINHPSDMAMPAGHNRLSVGNGGENDSSDSVQLDALNHSLDLLHDARVARLNAVGIAVAQLVLQPRNLGGMDLRPADAAIANALQSLTQN